MNTSRRTGRVRAKTNGPYLQRRHDDLEYDSYIRMGHMGDLATLTWQFRQLADGTTRKFQQFTDKKQQFAERKQCDFSIPLQGKTSIAISADQ